MPSSLPVDAFVKSLTTFKANNIFNPWTDVSPTDASDEMPLVRQQLLSRHLSIPAPQVLIVNDTASYYGSRHTGVSMTSEFLVLKERIPRLYYPSRLTNTVNIFFDPNASMLWRALWNYGLAGSALCWDLLPFQPCLASTGHNRRPNKKEMEFGRPWITRLLDSFPHTPLIGLGARVRDLIGDTGLRPTSFLPHPSRGGSVDLDQAIKAVASGNLSG